VLEAAVVSIPHDTWGEVGRAFLVVEDGFNEEELRDFVGERLAKYKQPRSIVVIDKLPLTAIGKIDKKVLEAWEQTS
jgi:acyl-CoA synthetase (AMP-forming)/AMP-acid ligase II